MDGGCGLNLQRSFSENLLSFFLMNQQTISILSQYNGLKHFLQDIQEQLCLSLTTVHFWIM